MIAVIGILASIAIVSYTGSQSRARKENYNSYASQVKLKLGEYYTDNNAYPSNKSAVMTYLNAIGGGSLATEFNKGDYAYNCLSSCAGFEIIVTGDKWGGPASERVRVTN